MEEILNIAICEDTAEEEEKLINTLNSCSIKANATCFKNAEELLSCFEIGKFDLLLMDIFMGEMTGIDAISKIREIDRDIPVAFITTSKDFALESYRLSALKYIEKPYGKKDIEGILHLAKIEKENSPCLSIIKDRKEELIRLSQIVYLETKGRQTIIYLKNGEIESFYGKLSSVINALPEEQFFLTHKSYCVNLNEVLYIDDELKCFMMSNGNNVPILRELFSRAKNATEEMLFAKARRMING